MSVSLGSKAHTLYFAVGQAETLLMSKSVKLFYKAEGTMEKKGLSIDSPFF
jgi:hypothetical protein